MFRRHGGAGFKTAVLFLAVGCLGGVIHGVIWEFVMAAEFGGPPRQVVVLSLVAAQALIVAGALVLAIGWGLKTWFPRLFLAGVVAALTSVLIEVFYRAVGLGWSPLHWMIASFFVGAMFGIVSGLSMVRFRKVLV